MQEVAKIHRRNNSRDRLIEQELNEDDKLLLSVIPEETGLKINNSNLEQMIDTIVNPEEDQDRIQVLVVDDNFYNIFAVTAMLQQYEIEADTATDGFEAIEKVKKLWREQQKTYDLIMMDYSMPLCSGIEATKEIRKYHTENS